MGIEAVVKLIVALAIALEISPEELAQIFSDEDKLQEYYDVLLAKVRE